MLLILSPNVTAGPSAVVCGGGEVCLKWKDVGVDVMATRRYKVSNVTR